MKKTGSTGNLFNNYKYDNIQESISSNIFFPRKISTIIATRNNNPINSFENESSLFLQINNNNTNSLLTKNSKQLYKELMTLKRKVNFLNGEISLAKSTKRKKDVQLNIKNKEIKGYLSDIKQSKDLNPINIDKLKETNIIGKLKKEFYKLKNTLNEIKNKRKAIETKLKKAKPNIIRQSNIILESKLKSLLQEYYILQDKNSVISNQLEEMKNYSIIFTENHQIIEDLKNKIEEKEKKIYALRENINELNNKQNINEELIDRQIIKNKSLKIKNLFLENEIESKKNISKLKIDYKNKIEKLTEKKDELEVKFKSNEKQINEIKENIREIEKMKQLDPLKLNAFDYSKIKKIEKNPDEIINSKILLLQSLITESLNNKKKYQESIQACIEKFEKYGYDYIELDKMLEEEDENKINNAEKRNSVINNDNKNDENINNNIENIDNKDNKDNKDINDNEDINDNKDNKDIKNIN